MNIETGIPRSYDTTIKNKGVRDVDLRRLSFYPGRDKIGNQIFQEECFKTRRKPL